jgi:uncharacterized membrane protein YkvA (DUF1232 family)
MAGRLARWARALRRESLALWYAARDPRTPWYAKAIAALVVAYAFSPLDLIPDPIPVLGYLDDLVIVPAGLWLALRLVPDEVMAAARARAAAADERPVSRAGAAAVVLVWLACAGAVAWWLLAG